MRRMTSQSLGRNSTKRRTSRIGMMAKIGVAGTDKLGQQFSVSGKATSLNHHGAALVVPCQVPVGAVITLRNSQTEEAVARIVAHIGGHAGTHTYGVEFLADAAGFWGITFPTLQN
jgi:hypothetical protein